MDKLADTLHEDSKILSRAAYLIAKYKIQTDLWFSSCVAK